MDDKLGKDDLCLPEDDPCLWEGDHEVGIALPPVGEAGGQVQDRHLEPPPPTLCPRAGLCNRYLEGLSLDQRVRG